MTPIRLGMVGGGEGAFIGAVHRIAARLDGHYALVAGALSSDPARAGSSAAALGIAPERSYADFRRMAAQEAARPDGVEAVAIVTPNHLHVPVARAFLAAGIHVICDKPLSTTLADAVGLADDARGADRAFVLTHAFTGYPMVRHARELVHGGALGAVRLVQAEYAQGWLADAVEDHPDTTAPWRLDPERGGAGGALGDIGTHAFHLAEYVTGLTAEAVSADLGTVVPGRRVPDDARIGVRWQQGGRGSIWVSQVASGEENALRIRVYGESGSLAWDQEDPNRLRVTRGDDPATTVTRGGPTTGSLARRSTRVPPGHPEGYLEAFAQIYTDAAEVIRGWPDVRPEDGLLALPGLRTGVRGMAFIDAALASGARDGAWTSLDVPGPA